MNRLPRSLSEALRRFSGHRALLISGGGGLVEGIVARRFDHLDALTLSDDPSTLLTAGEGAQNVTAATWSGESLPFRDGAFDAVFLVQAISRLSDWKHALKECLRTLRQRGQLVVLESRTQPANERQSVYLDLERLLRDRDIILAGQTAGTISQDELRKEMRAQDVHHIRLIEATGEDFDLDGTQRRILKQECLERIKSDLLPSLGRLGNSRDEFERRLIELKRRIEVIGVEPVGFLLFHGIRKIIYMSAETSLFAAETFQESEETATAVIPRVSAPMPSVPKSSFVLEDLSTADLFAYAMSGGDAAYRLDKLAQRVIKEYGSRGIAEERNPEVLAQSLGIGEARARQIVAIFELGRRFFASPDVDAPILRGPEDVVRYATEIGRLTREQFRGLFLNARQRLVADEVIAIGTLNSAIVHPREVFRPAFVHRAASVILIHNHPSGDPEPSTEDIELTRNLHKAGQIVGIELMDHIIIANQLWVSLKDRGLF